MCRSTCSTAHPRSRGENLHPLTPVRLTEGSSPLTRGKRTDKSAYLNELRLIPAHAGKTNLHVTSPFLSGAHPRSRGENTLRTLRQGSGPGSSPLTRGKLAERVSLAVPTRLIPAHAGKTVLHIGIDNL